MEIWKDILGYEGLYQVSTLGRVKSLPKDVWNGKGYVTREEKIFTEKLNKQGYNRAQLFKDGKVKTFGVHQLVAVAFLNHTIDGMNMVVDHLNCVKNDNRLENLQVITQRENTTKEIDNPGVYFRKDRSKYVARIKISGKYKHLGQYATLEQANTAYQNALSTL